MKQTEKYPKTDEGRKAFVRDSLRTLPRSVNVPIEFLTSKQIPDEGFTVIQVQKDKTLEILNSIASGIITVVLSPMLVVCWLYVGIKWIFSFHYPMPDEVRAMLRTRKYLHEVKKYNHEKK